MIASLLFGTTPLLAYLGPGGALSAIGSVLALLGALVLAVFGFVWYPLKRWRRARREKREQPTTPPGNEEAQA